MAIKIRRPSLRIDIDVANMARPRDVTMMEMEPNTYPIFIYIPLSVTGSRTPKRRRWQRKLKLRGWFHFGENNIAQICIFPKEVVQLIRILAGLLGEAVAFDHYWTPSPWVQEKMDQRRKRRRLKLVR